MNNTLRAICALCVALAPLPLAAQEGDAFVLPGGMARLRVGGIFSDADSRFAAGSTVPLAGDLLAPLTSQSFAPLLPLEAELNRFLSATANQPGASPLRADAQTLLLGTPDLEASINTQAVPLRVDVGLFAGLEVGAGISLLREERILTRTALAGGTVGLNPNAAGNARILAELGDEWRSLGQLPVLPTDSSALGRELQRRVQALGGAELSLPDGPADLAALNTLLASQLGLAPLAKEITPWRLGDLEVGARYRVLSSFGVRPMPDDSAGVDFRAAVSFSARLPIGTEPLAQGLLMAPLDVGHTGFGVGATGDLFVGRRFWATASAQYAVLAEREVTRRVVSPDQPLASAAPARAVSWTPASQLALRVAPRFRLTEEIALGAQYSLARVGDATFATPGGEPADLLPASVLNVAGGTIQRAGLRARYSTLPDFWEGRTGIPLEITLSYETTLTGPARGLDADIMYVEASLFPRFWGR